MSGDAPPAAPGASGGAARVFGTAAAGASVAFASLVVVSVLLALLVSLFVRAYGFWTWVKMGLLVALLSLRAGVTAIAGEGSFFGGPGNGATFRWRLVPMLLTIGFLLLAARAGRHAVRGRSGGSHVTMVFVAVTGAGASVAALSALAATLVTLLFPKLGVTIGVGPGSAALWGGITAAAGVATGAFLERSRNPLATAGIRGGLAGYGWALALLSVGILVVATLEPTVTRAYVDGLRQLGGGGAALFGTHLLALPAQSALLLAPAAGTCLRVIGESGGVELCPWSLTGIGLLAPLLPDRLALTPLLWGFSAVPFAAAVLGGRRAGLASGPARAVRSGALAGVVFAFVAVVAAWYVSPQLPVVTIPEVTIDPNEAVMGVTLTLWGLAGGALGGWLAGRSYVTEPEPPSPTSA